MALGVAAAVIVPLSTVDIGQLRILETASLDLRFRLRGPEPPGDKITVSAASDAHFVLVGGAAMDGPRHIWWNFVSSRKERIEQAKADWKAGHFNKVPGDEIEFIPLPEK